MNVKEKISAFVHKHEKTREIIVSTISMFFITYPIAYIMISTIEKETTIVWFVSLILTLIIVSFVPIIIGGEHIIQKILRRPKVVEKVNEYITLKLIKEHTVIYINGKVFDQCKRILFLNPQDRKESDFVESIDEAKDVLTDENTEKLEPKDFGIDPKTEFWAHHSNISAWVEHDYDTRLIHSNLGFPILKKLSEIGDAKAKNIFRDEVIERFLSGYLNTIKMIIATNCFDQFNKNQLDMLLDDLIKKNKDVENLLIEIGIMFTSRKKLKFAKLAYEKAIYLNPLKDRAWAGLMAIHLQKDKYEEAIEPLLRCTELDPNNKHYWYLLAWCYERTGEEDKIKEPYEKYLEIHERSGYDGFVIDDGYYEHPYPLRL